MTQRSGRWAVAIGHAAVCLLLLGNALMPGSALSQPVESRSEPTGAHYGPVEAILLRSTLIAINQANATGEYKVLGALIAPDVAQKLSVASLEAIFRPWRDKRRDIGFAVIAEPAFQTAAVQPSSGELWLVGTVPTPGFELEFDFAFRKVSDRWLLARFSIADGTLTISSAVPPPAKRTVVVAPIGGAETVSSEVPLKNPPLPPDRPWF
ncbi:hypothetical protein C3941_08855 [Kaistia algarum]|uniref:hypothetical protein n=1 Tax=Kaistia algarum TaxID=2083279 RepID=UPI000CE76C52|nr:hypothetical protein [Kaistia algarum]MCX5512167.1 hypothetical protein [Kaistia algarum]PPE80268.1 hypothetical protein C3941_08855 [Kaistia algarum]